MNGAGWFLYHAAGANANDFRPNSPVFWQFSPPAPLWLFRKAVPTKFGLHIAEIQHDIMGIAACDRRKTIETNHVTN